VLYAYGSNTNKTKQVLHRTKKMYNQSSYLTVINKLDRLLKIAAPLNIQAKSTHAKKSETFQKGFRIS
jgi:hypothetical protein